MQRGMRTAYPTADAAELALQELVSDGLAHWEGNDTSEGGRPTRRFYLKHGYTAAAGIPDFYADGDGMAVFTKRV